MEATVVAATPDVRTLWHSGRAAAERIALAWGRPMDQQEDRRQAVPAVHGLQDA